MSNFYFLNFKPGEDDYRTRNRRWMVFRAIFLDVTAHGRGSARSTWVLILVLQRTPHNPKNGSDGIKRNAERNLRRINAEAVKTINFFKSKEIGSTRIVA